MANSFSLTQYTLDETLVRFLANIKLAKTAYRKFEKKYENLEFAPGETINYRLEENYIAEAGWAATEQGISQRIRALTVDENYHVLLGMDGSELTLDRQHDKKYLDDHLLPVARSLAEKAEGSIATELLNSVYYAVGTPGTAISSPSLINQARGFMQKVGIPSDGLRYLALGTDASVSLANGTNNYFNSKVNSAALMDGYLGTLADFDLFETVFLGRHISGIGAGGAASGGKIAAGQVNATTASGNTIVVKGLQNSTAGTFKKGDVIEVAGSNFVHPTTKIATNQVAQFIVTADAATTSAGGVVTITVSPAIVTSGVFQNIDVALQANASINLYASHDVSVGYHRNAIVFAAPPIKLLEGGVVAARSFSKDYQISMTYTKGADIRNYKQLDRMDILFGVTVNPEYAVRIMS